MRGDRLRFTEPSTGTELPRLESRVVGIDRRTTLVTTYGRRFRVQDYAYQEHGPPGRPWRRLPTPASSADYRVFTALDGSVLVYRFGRGEHRWMDPYRPERIEQQLRRAVPAMVSLVPTTTRV